MLFDIDQEGAIKVNYKKQYPTNGLVQFMSLMNMLGAFESPEGMIHCSYSPSWVKGGL